MYINDNYLKLQAGYLFPEIARRVAEYGRSNPHLASRVVRCGIGDVTEPLPEAARTAMHRAIDELGAHASFVGYGPPFGHESVRRTTAEGDFRSRGLEVHDDEIFLSDGSKGDCGAILDILAPGRNRIAVPDPVYPVYVDTNVMVGNTGAARPAGGYEGLLYLQGRPENDFIPEPPATEQADVVYLCFPNNPTGAAIDRPALERWVRWAREAEAVILYDAAYEAYITDPALPRSIYEIPGARECAIEFRSFSKNGGFTGVRCGFTVCPKSLKGRTLDGRAQPLHPLWARRWSTKSNGVSYPVQRGAEALYSAEGKAQVSSLVALYLANAGVLRRGVEACGLRAWGGINAPYVWVQCPAGLDSWGVFDLLLHEAQVVVTPGAGFGACGEGFFRISAFNSRDNVQEVVQRLRALDGLSAPR